MFNANPEILGIVNVTRDSFSDGGRYLDPLNAIVHGLRLLEEGATIIDVGAESTHPDAEPVPAQEEIHRLSGVVKKLKEEDACVSVDTHKPEVMKAVLELGADIINDVTACRDPKTWPILANSDAKIIVMHSTAARAKADRKVVDPETIVDQIVEFFGGKLDELTGAGIHRERIILDPGLGFFIGSNHEASLAVLRGIGRLKTLGQPICIAASRKSFIGAVLESAENPRPVEGRLSGTLATEMWSLMQGVEYIRTHQPRPLCDMVKMLSAIDGF